MTQEVRVYDKWGNLKEPPGSGCRSPARSCCFHLARFFWIEERDGAPRGCTGSPCDGRGLASRSDVCVSLRHPGQSLPHP